MSRKMSTSKSSGSKPQNASSDEVARLFISRGPAGCWARGLRGGLGGGVCVRGVMIDGLRRGELLYVVECGGRLI